MIVMPYLWQSLAGLAIIAVVLVVTWVVRHHQDGKPKPTWNKQERKRQCST